MQILKTFTQGILKQKTGAYKHATKTVVIGDYPTLTKEQLVALVKEYEKNPEPGYYYFVYDETKQEVIYSQRNEIQNQNYIRILDPLCVNKTYPDYWKDFKKLTGASFEIPKAK